MGVPGVQQHLTMRYRYGDPNDPRNAGGLGGGPGKYKVVFTLSRPGFSLLPEKSFHPASMLNGDSHLGIAKPAVMFADGEDYNHIILDCSTTGERFEFKGLS